MAESYFCTNSNRLSEPLSYMYPPFEGASFFKLYFSDRQKNMQKLECYSDTLEPNIRRLVYSRFFTTGPSLPRAAYTSQGAVANVENTAVDTAELLLRMIDQFATGGTLDPIDRWFLDRLLQKFEVTKKLYDYYPGWKKKGAGEATHLSLYAYFSLILGAAYARSGLFQFLNASLKVNDILCSVGNAVCAEPLIAGTAYHALKTELFNVSNLMNAKGLGNEIP